MPEEELQQIVVYIIAYLRNKNGSRSNIAPLYIAISMSMRLGQRISPEITEDLSAAVREAKHNLGNLSAPWTDRMIETILSNSEMRKWHSTYKLHYYTRDDWMNFYLKYVGRIGPALGRSLLQITNMNYLLLIAMSIRTGAAFDNTGQWPNTPTCGEEWNSDKWKVNCDEPWEPVKPGVIQALLVVDRSVGYGLFPAYMKKGVEQIETINVPQIFANICNTGLNPAIVRTGKLLHDSCLELGSSNPTIPDYKATALELMFDKYLDRGVIRQCDYLAHEYLDWRPVSFDEDTCSLIEESIRVADSHARNLLKSKDAEVVRTAKRVLTSDLILLAYAGLLRYAKSQPSSNWLDRSLQIWPFTVPDINAPKLTRKKLESKLVEYLGETRKAVRSKRIGLKRLQIWLG